jgi:hypothetical protein
MHCQQKGAFVPTYLDIQTIVNLALVGVQLFVEHFVQGDEATSDAGFEHGIGDGHRTGTLIEIDFDGPLALDAEPKVGIFNGNQLAIGLFEWQLVAPKPIAAKERGGRFIQVEIRDEIKDAAIVKGFVAAAV